MGMVKSFRSSDRHGTEGFQYGDEWYNRLMEKLDKASDVVCLFTRRSLNPPWILYEAGVAKGKLGTRVYGVALGVPLGQVSAGPFYQFENCQDDEDGLTGLVMQLLRQLPTADPDGEAILPQVQTFRAHVKEILAAMSEEGGEDEGDADSGEASVARLFEEMKVLLRDLPSRFEERLAEGAGPVRRRRPRRFHPMMIEEMAHMMGGKAPEPFLGILIIASLFRDDVPWLYEIGMEAYRTAKSGSPKEAERALRTFRRAAEVTTQGQFMEESGMDPGEAEMMLGELPRVLNHIVEREMRRVRRRAPTEPDEEG